MLLSECELSVYALSLLRGPSFDAHMFHSGWKVRVSQRRAQSEFDPDSSTFSPRLDHERAAILNSSCPW
jgi:hypothetical protein